MFGPFHTPQVRLASPLKLMIDSFYIGPFTHARALQIQHGLPLGHLRTHVRALQPKGKVFNAEIEVGEMNRSLS